MNRKHFAILLANLVLLTAPPSSLAAEIDSIEPIGTMGKGVKVLGGGKEAVLFEHEGKGCLSHFWFGGAFDGEERTRIRYYVDGEETPSIDMELYPGHGIGFNEKHAPWATKYVGKIGRRNGVHHNYRIPFGKSIRVTAQLGEGVQGDPHIWWIIRGMENGRVTLGGVELPESARLKLHRIDDLEVQPLEEYDLCHVEGKGALFKVYIAAESRNLNYLESCIRGYFGGAKEPIFLSSGLEDYFLGTYYFNTGIYHSDMAGCTHLDPKKGRFSGYRFHDEDPVIFQNGLRLTNRCGETEHGTIDGKAHLNPLATRFTSYVWVYQW